jgi:hypothetical protein
MVFPCGEARMGRHYDASGKPVRGQARATARAAGRNLRAPGAFFSSEPAISALQPTSPLHGEWFATRIHSRRTNMTRTKKSFAAAVAALALGASVFAASDAEARPRYYRGAAIGAGVVGALALGALAAGAASGPAYGYYDEPVYAGPVRRCHLVDRVNYYGEVIGSRRVCRTYY